MANVASIVLINATPSPASPGQTVNVKVSVQNLGFAPAGYNYIALTGAVDSTVLPFTPDYQYADAQATVEFSASFTMPSKKTTVTVYSWYWDFSTNTWVVDDAKYIEVEVSVVAGWILAPSATMLLNVGRAAGIAGWVLAQSATTTIMVNRGTAVISGWVIAATATKLISIKRPGGEPVPSEIPWVPIAIGAAVAVVIGAALAATKKPPKKSKSK